MLEYAEQKTLQRSGWIGLQGLRAVRLLNISAYSSGTERCDQLVGWTELARSQLGWRHRLQHPDPLRHVHAQIRLRGLSALVTEPQCDFANVPGRLQDGERARVAPMFPST